MIAVVVLGLTWGAGFFRWLGLGASDAAVAAGLQPWLIPFAVIAAGAIAVVLAGRRLPPRQRPRLLGGLVLTDLVAFTLLAVVAVLPGLGGGTGSGHHGAVAGRRRGKDTSAVLLGESSGGPGAGRPAPARPVAALATRNGSPFTTPANSTPPS